MAKQVTAILVVHDESVLAQRALSALQSQTVVPDRILVIDSSKNPQSLTPADKTLHPKAKLGELVSAAVENLEVSDEHWYWLVHDDSEPKPNALAELLLAVETSEKIAQVGPMQLSIANPRQISQLGLTLSPFGDLINPIKGQLDQSQHDQVFDSLAVSTSATLIRSDIYQLVGGFDDRAPALAADFDLSIRIRRHGYRVVVAPRAKVIHAALSLAGKRQNGWLAGGIKTAMRRAAINLHLVHNPLPVALLYWLALPLITLYRVFWRLAQKRPGHIWSELRAGFWVTCTLPKRLLSRAKSGPQGIGAVKSLRASSSMVSAHKRADLEAEESANTLAAFERGDHELPALERAKTFTGAGGWFFTFALLALAWQQFPLAQALQGPGALPLAQNWFDLFARAGASYQPIGQGFFGPFDPFNWVILFIGSLTFWSPNLSLVVLVWVAKALAFITAWKALSLITAKAWQRNLGAFTYALLPAFSASLSVGEYPAVVATIVLPWLVYAIARAAGLGRRGSARSDARTWSWIGLSGVLLAVVGAANPALGILALAGLGVAAFTKLRRFGYLFWIPLPLAAIYLPLFVYQTFTLGQPLAILAEPTVGASENTSAFDTLVDVSQWTQWSLAIVAVLALLATLTKRWVVSLAIATFTVLAFVVLDFTKSLSFPADLLSSRVGIERTLTSGNAIAALIGLAVITLAAHFLAQLSNRAALASLGVALALSTVPLSWASLTTATALEHTDGTVVPLLLQKQSEQGSKLQLLTIAKTGDVVRAELSELGGTTLEDSNLAYRFSDQATSSPQLSGVIADLASGNGAANADALEELRIGYLLVPDTDENAELVAALESSTILESAGLTPYGNLWRVLGVDSSQVSSRDDNPWSVTKAVQLMSLLGFVLLAIPSRPKAKKPTDTAIFIDQSESELDV